jgi:glycosyltransferase involved in cell wall biosynthesis
MRILHFTNIPFSIDQISALGRSLNTGGGWMAVLLGRMLQMTDFTFACAAFGNVKRVETARGDRIECFVIPKQGKAGGLQRCREIVDEYKPDLIHIHGTESAYGLLTARGMVNCPAVISIQGLLGPCSEWYRYFGNRSLFDVFRMHRWLEFPALRGHLMGFWRIRNSAKREREIIRGNHIFMGRTAWDHAHLMALNPSAKYFIENRMLREPFWQNHWDLGQAQRHRIIFTNAGHPRKGTETLLDAASLLQPNFPDLQVCIAGEISRRSGYGRYLRRRIVAMNGAAVELGQLDSEQMVEELRRSHVFVSPSFIDNSPNAVCEAQLLGMPVISTYTGGVPSLIEDGRTGLFFPTGDAPMMAALLRQVFDDDELAMRLGQQSREVATLRHNPDSIVSEIISVYEHVAQTCDRLKR